MSADRAFRIFYNFDCYLPKYLLIDSNGRHLVVGTRIVTKRIKVQMRAMRAAGRVVTRAERAGGRVPNMPHARTPHLTLGGRLSLHPDRTSCCGAVWVVNLSAGRTCSWSAIDGSRTPARDRRRDGLGTFACAAAFDRSAASAAPARARGRRIQPSAGAATAFDGARTSPPEQPA